MVTQIATFQYMARDTSGQLIRDSIVLESARLLKSRLSSQGLKLLSYSEQAINEPNDPSLLQQLSPSSWLAPRSTDLQIALEQMSMMLRNGIGLIKTLEGVAKQTRSQRLARKMEMVSQDILRGETLSRSLSKHRAFPSTVLQLVEVGESTGDLALVLERAAKLIAFRRKNWTALFTALAYPLFAVTAALAVTIYLVVAVIPQLSKFLSSMGRKLPQMTQSLMDLSFWIQGNGVTALGMVGISLAVAAWVYLQPTGRMMVDRWLLRIPVVGPILRTTGTITLSSSLAIMIRSGLSLSKSLAASERIHNNRFLAAQVTAAKAAVERGDGFSESLATPFGYMPMLSSMVAVAEQTGELDEVLEQVSQFYDEQLQGMIKRLSAWMEPAMIVMVGGIVGYVYMAFFIALMSAGGTVR